MLDEQTIEPPVATPADASTSRTVPHRPKVRRPPAVVIACGNMKGGVGKSSTCASLASALARDFAVLAIDLDHQGQLGQDLGIELDPGDAELGEWLVKGGDPHGFMYETESGVDVIPAAADWLSEATRFIEADPMERLPILAERLAEVRGEYDFVVIDPPAGSGTLTNVGLAATNVVLPIVTPDYAAWTSGNKFIVRVEQVRRRLNPGLLLGPIVRNAYASGSSVTEQQRLVDESIASSGYEVWPQVIARSEYISKARGLMQPAERAFAKQLAIHRYRDLAHYVSDWCAVKGI